MNLATALSGEPDAGFNLRSGTAKPDLTSTLKIRFMNESDYKIVRLTNISNFDFTGELGARFGGRDFFVPAGGSLLCPLTVGDHLATHLARQILIQKAPVRDANETDGKGSDRPLWDDAKIAELKSKILAEVYEEEKQRPLTEAERMAQKVADLNKVVPPEEPKAPEGGNADASGIVPADDSPSSQIVYKDKAQVIEELKKKGVTFDARASKDKLEELLKV